MSDMQVDEVDVDADVDVNIGRSAQGVEQQGPLHPWQTGLFDCCEDGCASFCCSVCVPCLSFGCIAEIVDQGSTGCCCLCCIYFISGLFCGLSCYAGWYRGKMRKQYGLIASPLPDRLVHLFCHTCALAQERRELASRGFNVTNGWNGRPVDRPTVARGAPRVQKPMTRNK